MQHPTWGKAPADPARADEGAASLAPAAKNCLNSVSRLRSAEARHAHGEAGAAAKGSNTPAGRRSCDLSRRMAVCAGRCEGGHGGSSQRQHLLGRRHQAGNVTGGGAGVIVEPAGGQAAG